MNKPIVIDTNIVLLDVSNLYALQKLYPQSTICIPETVVEELDSKKTLQNELGFQARSFGRLVAKAKSTTIKLTDQLTETKYTTSDISLSIISSSTYPTSCYDSDKSANDNKIIHIAAQLDRAAYSPLFISNDIMCRIKAQAVNLRVSDFKDVDDVNIQFTRDLVVPSRVYKALHSTPIFEVDPDHKPHDFSYVFTCAESGATKLGTIVNDTIRILGKETEREVRNQDINPQNKEQLLFSAMIQDPTTDITVCESLAGSGKTLVAISNAMKLVDTNDQYESIVYIRNTVNDTSNKDEEIGFLSGNEEKLEGYLHPFYDSLSSIIRNKPGIKGKPKRQIEEIFNQELESIINKYDMIPMVALGLRGRTIDNSIIIVDEAQNISKATMQKILSRIGKNCKVIVLGSLRQIDSSYVTKYTSGLSILLDATKRTDLPIKLNAITLKKVVRGRITEFSELIFS